MVSNRRLEYGFSGYQVPATPRAPRSARRRCSIQKKVDDRKMHAFNLLAAVAGELLLEKAVCPSSSTSSTQKDQCPINEAGRDKEWQDRCNPLELKPSVHENRGKSFVVSELFSPDKDKNNGSEFKGKDDSVSSAIEVGLHEDSGSYSNQEDEVRVHNKEAQLNNGNFACSSDIDLCSLGSPIKCIRDNRKVFSRDDDDNLPGCTHPGTMKKKPFTSVPRIGDRRIRKILASKYWKAPKLKVEHCSRSDGNLKVAYWNRKGCYRHQRSQRNYPFKKRFFNINCSKNSDGRDRSLAPEKDFNGDVSEDGPSPFKEGQHSLYRRRDSHVKLRIKSLRVPELYIEVAETATVGSLKRTVMEALSAILRGGVRVGVLLRGKKVRDDSKTLLQSGISHDNRPDALGFTLEPSSSLAPAESPAPGLSPASLPCDASQPYAGYATDSVAHQGPSLPLIECQGANLVKPIKNDNHNAAAPIDIPIDECSVDSRALVAVPTTTSREALAVVPVQQKLGKSEIAQRRVRRPFSVAEVEALVQAVEKLGTGRWRDVKMQAFDDAKHRTYVDLKDKWKTLVHTARISPQQRRGEPVPQELLDRVLAAHAYWSYHQSEPQQQQLSDA
ncbi:telomere repeat-binding protein 2-like [Punica granatum]|nr:telomere repeat-binding protein 2-like [Punica granatum]